MYNAMQYLVCLGTSSRYDYSFHSFNLHRLVLGLEKQFHYITPCYEFVINICNQNLVHEFMACQDVKFSFEPYECNL